MWGNDMRSIWLDFPALIDQLKILVADKWSATDAAQRLGELTGRLVTRNQVIGKCRRLGLSFHSDLTERARPTYKPPMKVWKPAASPSPMAESFKGVSLLELGKNQCRYPEGDGPFLFCAAQTADGESYCTHHANICFTGFGKLGGNNRCRSTTGAKPTP